MSESEGVRRTPLNRERVLAAAVAFADREAGGTDALSMRKLAQDLGVVPMALYKHVANKEELLAGMVDTVVGGIDPARHAAPTGRRPCANASCPPAGRCAATRGRRA